MGEFVQKKRCGTKFTPLLLGNMNGLDCLDYYSDYIFNMDGLDGMEMDGGFNGLNLDEVCNSMKREGMGGITQHTRFPSITISTIIIIHLIDSSSTLLSSIHPSDIIGTDDTTTYYYYYYPSKNPPDE